MSAGLFTPTGEQERVIGHARSAFVCACPGAGKTQVLVERARLLLRDKSQWRGVAFLSFTNAAVSELEGRLQEEGLLSSPAFPHFVGTFDRFIWQFLFAPFGLPGGAAAPRLVPDKDQWSIRPYEGAQLLALHCFDRSTGAAIPSETQRFGFDPAAIPSRTKAYETAARNSRAQSLARGEVDFSDVRMIAAARLKDASLARRLAGALKARFREVIVDEAQDCNPADLNIISWLRGIGAVTKVVCDPHQSIYEFRGGVTRELLDFGRTFDKEDQLALTGNFRSTEDICKATGTLRELTARRPADRALGSFRADNIPVYILAYSAVGVPPAIGAKFQELLEGLGLVATDCPVVAATKNSAHNATGQPGEPDTEHSTLQLASAVTAFHFTSGTVDRKTALEQVHKIVLKIEGRLSKGTYHQYLAAEEIEPDSWRPRILRLVRELRYDSNLFPQSDDWHEKAKALLEPTCLADGRTIAQRLRNHERLGDALVAARVSSPPARTIHAVKGMQFPAICVVMTQSTTKKILDFLETGNPAEQAENARKIYVAASRAQRLLAIAVPKKQADRLAKHIASLGAQVSRVEL